MAESSRPRYVTPLAGRGRVIVPLAALAAALVLATSACGSNPPPPASSPSSTSSSSPSSAPVSPTPTLILTTPTPPPVTEDEARAVLDQFLTGSCRALTTETSQAPLCPITDRLRSHLESARISGPGGGDEWTRSQFTWSVASVAVEQTSGGAVAHVVLTTDTTGYGDNRLDLALVRDSTGAVLVDDVTCTGGGAQTSLYLSPYGDPSPQCYTSPLQ